MSAMFRGKFLAALKQLFQNDELSFFGSAAALENKADFLALLKRLYTSKWVVYAKAPFGGPQQVLRYLGRYTHRIAISNRRIISLHEGKVTFTYKDRKDNDRDKTLTLDTSEFIRRFLIHVLPQGFHKIRYFGLLAIRNRKSKLVEAQRQLNPADQKNLPGLCIIEEASISRPPCPACGANAWHCLQVLPTKLFKSTSKFKPPRPPPGAIELQSNR